MQDKSLATPLVNPRAQATWDDKENKLTEAAHNTDNQFITVDGVILYLQNPMGKYNLSIEAVAGCRAAGSVPVPHPTEYRDA